uniref:DNA helicase n=1 Tax=Heterorhabditis bacteriophora TaxID=37862 RepID=A0A1I7XAM1_HETBA
MENCFTVRQSYTYAANNSQGRPLNVIESASIRDEAASILHSRLGERDKNLLTFVKGNVPDQIGDMVLKMTFLKR